MTSLRTPSSTGFAAWLRAVVIVALIALAVPALAVAADASDAGTTAAAEPSAGTQSAQATQTTQTTQAGQTSQPAGESTPAEPAAAQPGPTPPAPVVTPPAPVIVPVVVVPPIPVVPAPPPSTGPTPARPPTPQAVDPTPSQPVLPPVTELLPAVAPALPELVPSLPTIPDVPRARPATTIPVVPDAAPPATPDTRFTLALPSAAPDLPSVSTSSSLGAPVLPTITLGAPPKAPAAGPGARLPDQPFADTGLTAPYSLARASAPDPAPPVGRAPSDPRFGAPRAGSGENPFDSHLEASGGPAPAGSSLLAVLASYVLPGSGTLPAQTTLFLFVQLAILMALALAPRPGRGERLVLWGLLSSLAGHRLAVRRPG